MLSRALNPLKRKVALPSLARLASGYSLNAPFATKIEDAHYPFLRPRKIDIPKQKHDALTADVIRNYYFDRTPMWSLPADFYTSKAVYDVDLEHIWRKSWLQVAYSCEIKESGQYVKFKMHDDEVIIVRGDDGEVRAFYNTCRHRGSRICKEDSGKVRSLVCPYHQWSYGLDGKLKFARYMGKDFDKNAYNLIKCHVEELDGLLFISLADDPLPFDECREYMSHQLKPHGLEKAKIAHRDVHHIDSNWKLVYENNRECYHCNIGHPEYIQGNYDTAFIYVENDDGVVERIVDPSHPRREKIEAHIAKKTEDWKELGFECSPNNEFPGAGYYRASRAPLKDGCLVESLDGQPVSTLMGDLPNYDMGSFRIHTLPNFWIHLSADHAVSTVLIPTSPTTTKAVVTWLVDENAEEGKDYHLDQMLPLWHQTSIQDYDLCETNQKGVQSSRYQQGPLSPEKERAVERFYLWYLRSIAATHDPIMDSIPNRGSKEVEKGKKTSKKKKM